MKPKAELNVEKIKTSFKEASQCSQENKPNYFKKQLDFFTTGCKSIKDTILYKELYQKELNKRDWQNRANLIDDDFFAFYIKEKVFNDNTLYKALVIFLISNYASVKIILEIVENFDYILKINSIFLWIVIPIFIFICISHFILTTSSIFNKIKIKFTSFEKFVYSHKKKYLLGENQ